MRPVEGWQRGGGDVAGGGEVGDSCSASEAEGTGASDARLAEDPEIAGKLSSSSLSTRRGAGKQAERKRRRICNYRRTASTSGPCLPVD